MSVGKKMKSAKSRALAIKDRGYLLPVYTTIRWIYKGPRVHIHTAYRVSSRKTKAAQYTFAGEMSLGIAYINTRRRDYLSRSRIGTVYSSQADTATILLLQLRAESASHSRLFWYMMYYAYYTPALVCTWSKMCVHTSFFTAEFVQKLSSRCIFLIWEIEKKEPITRDVL